MKLTWMKDVTVFYTPGWNVILLILRSKIDFHSTEINLGSQNWQDYISNTCVTYRNIFHWSEFHVASLLRCLLLQFNILENVGVVTSYHFIKNFTSLFHKNVTMHKLNKGILESLLIVWNLGMVLGMTWYYFVFIRWLPANNNGDQRLSKLKMALGFHFKNGHKF